MNPPEPTDDLLGVLHLASELAGRLRHAEVLPEHVLMAITRDPAAAEALGVNGIDARRLESDLREFLLHTAAPARAWHLLGPSYAPALRRALEHAVRRRAIAGRDTVGVGDLLVAILREEVPAAVAVHEHSVASARGAVYRESHHRMVHPVHRLQKSDFSLVDLLAWLAHGHRTSDVPTAGAAQDVVWVVLHNDDFTTFDFVQEVLHTEFGKESPAALAISQAVHAYGRETLGRYLRGNAEGCVRRALQRARAAGFPLRITLETRAPDKDPGTGR